MDVEALPHLVGETCDVVARGDSAFYLGMLAEHRLACCMRESRARTAHMSRESPAPRIRACRRARQIQRHRITIVRARRGSPHDTVHGA